MQVYGHHLNSSVFCVQIKLKKRAFWQQTHQMGLVWMGIKSTPCVQSNIFNVVGLFFCRRSWTSCSDTGIMDSIKYQQINQNQNQNLTSSARNLIMSHGWFCLVLSSPLTRTQLKSRAYQHEIRIFMKIGLWPPNSSGIIGLKSCYLGKRRL